MPQDKNDKGELYTREQVEDALFGPVIYSYTRAQAIEDGVLIDVSSVAEEAGIRYPVAVTQALWDKHIAVPPRLKGSQDESGRLWDVLWIFRNAARRNSGSEIRFVVLFAEKQNRPPFRRTLKAVCGPGDNAEPVITIMLPDED